MQKQFIICKSYFTTKRKVKNRKGTYYRNVFKQKH